jgi:predicted chitinase
MSYTDKLSNEQKGNIRLIKDEMLKAGITNPFAQAGILAIISKESAFVPVREKMKYSAGRIREVWPGTSQQEAERLAGNPVALGDKKYGGRYGTPEGKGYYYRGGGFQQLTFGGTYKKYGDLIGVDLFNKPEKIEDPKVAAAVVPQWFLNGIDSLKRKGKLKEYNATSINDFKNVEDATMAMYHVNAGTGNSVSYIKGLTQSDTLGGMRKALNRVGDLMKYAMGLPANALKKKPVLTVILIAAVVVSVGLLYKTLNKK